MHLLDSQQKSYVLGLLEERDKLTRLQTARERFLPFVNIVWPDFIAGAHHTLMAEKFEAVADGRIKRLILDMPPRFTKSEFGSWLLPAWFLGRFPKKKIIQVSNNDDLASGFGRRVRNLLDGVDLMTSDKDAPRETYQDVFPSVKLASDSKAAGLWHTNWGGEYFSVGVKGKVTGRGADIAIVDDPHALEVTTEIPTTDGFKTIEEIEVGDYVFGPDGLPTRVTAKSEVWHQRQLYSVTTNDAQTIYCDAAHLWSYRAGTNLKLPFYVMSTFELSKWAKANKPVIPRHAAVQYPDRDLPIDPYILGAWLGDGTSSLGRMTAHPDDQPYMRSQFKAAGYELTDQVDPLNFGVLGLRRQLINLGVLNNKHIPEMYMTASASQRLALLQGLMDTDGTVAKLGQCSFDNANERLVRQVQELVHSLGSRAALSHITDKRGRWGSAQVMHRVNFKMADAARMPRKRERAYTPTDKRGRSIVVEPTDRYGSVQCITVEREDGLFLAGRGYVVTHNSEQEAKQAESNPAVFDDVYAWYTSGIRQRLQPGGSIIIIVTRWSKRDLVGQVIRQMERDIAAGVPEDQYDQWEVLSLPAILDENTPTERSMWPGFWPLPELQRTRNALPVAKWQAQYQQNPTSEGAAILKRDYWRKWGADTEKCPGPKHIKAWETLEPPACKYVIGSWDCASTKTDRSHPSAYTLWGVFEAEDPSTGKEINNIILLSSFKARMEFPELKKKAKQFYEEDQPDTLLIENKSAGMQLLQEFRSMGIPAESFTGSSRGSRTISNDKIARANLVADIFASRYCWAPERRFADEVIEQCASFPAGDEDDLVDSTVQAMLRFREGGFIRTANDEEEDIQPRARRKRYY